MKFILITKIIDKSFDDTSLSSILENEVDDTFNYISLRPKEEKYKLNEIKTFTQKLSKKPDELNTPNAFVILEGHNLSAICQNALLKTLEESRYTIIILTRNIDALLPTVRSRCQIIYRKYEVLETNVEEEHDILDYKNIPTFSKRTREDIKKTLTSKFNSFGINEEKASILILLNEAIKKIDSNCKIESVLYDLIWKVQNINGR